MKKIFLMGRSEAGKTSLTQKCQAEIQNMVEQDKREGNNLAGDVKPTFVNTHLFDAIFPFVPFGFHVLPPSSFYAA